MRLLHAWPVAAVALLLAVTGCTAPAAEPAPSLVAPVATTLPGQDPVDLIGLWDVSGAPGQHEKQWIRMDENELLLFEPCGIYSGGWRAGQGLFVTEISGGLGGSCDLTHRAEHWLYDVTGYQTVGVGRVRLTGLNGAVVATLTTATEDAPHSANYVDDLTQAPPVDAEASAKLALPSPLPSGARPVVPEGRWIPVGRTGTTDTFLTFAASPESAAFGSWTGSDGCNDSGGRWFAGDGGLFGATVGAVTGMACPGSPAPYWMSGVGRMAMVGAELTLYDVDGKKLGSLVRDETVEG